jgi:hypothetical protein
MKLTEIPYDLLFTLLVFVGLLVAAWLCDMHREVRQDRETFQQSAARIDARLHRMNKEKP